MTPVRAALAAALLVASTGCSSDDGDLTACPDAVLGVGSSAAEASAAVDGSPSTVTVAPGGTLFAAASRLGGCGTRPGDGPDGIRLFVVQGDQRVSVGRVAAAGGAFDISFGIPATLVPGAASVVAQSTLDPEEEPLASAPVTIG